MFSGLVSRTEARPPIPAGSSVRSVVFLHLAWPARTDGGRNQCGNAGRRRRTAQKEDEGMRVRRHLLRCDGPRPGLPAEGP